MKYDHQKIEKKWQDFWEQNATFKTKNDFTKPKYYTLDMFPYPSGAGLHVGHPEGMTANDIVARYKNANGYNVLHPMGWDAFGLPAENYAIKTGTHPRVTTDENIDNFRRQIKALGFSYDWDREVDTTDPEYYRWTQWIFLKLFEKGLAYEQDLPINYCPSCQTGLANEEVLNNFTCERCGAKVEKKRIRQWVLGITKYAERLLGDVDRLDWSESIKEMQRNWIGKSEGCEFTMVKSDDPTKSIGVYTTRIDTVFGVTYAVLAPDHPHVTDFITDDQKVACEKYISDSAGKSDQDRTADNKEKTGVFTGSHVVNPFNGKEVPLWIGDYVLGNYGTGAVMAVPAHDERDFEFAKQYGLDIDQVVAPFIIHNWISAPKDDLEILHRPVVDMVLENDKWEILLQVEEEWEHKHIHFPGGGIEDGNTELETVIKELTEETGYTDLEITEPIHGSYKSCLGYRHTKGKNQQTFGRFFHVKLLSDKQIPSEIDEGKHSIIWVKKEEVSDKITWDNHAYIWNIYCKGFNSFVEDGTLVNSGDFTNLSSSDARTKLVVHAEKEGFGSKKVNYKLRDWLFSRQRYWGEPIPLIHLENSDIESLPTSPSTEAWIKNGKTLMIGEEKFSDIHDGLYGKIACDYRLPLKLPEVDDFAPAGDGNSPLSKVDDFVNVQLATNLSGKRETNTMPQWGGSCWYYLRYMDPNNSEALVDPEVVKYWGEVDSYVGGAEHAVLHLLYARFWHKFLYDINVVPTDEPFYRLRNQGLILAHAFQKEDGGLVANDLVEEKNGEYTLIETGEPLKRIVSKMSKSLKNVVNPDDIVEEYGADSLRLYEMYIADFKDAAPWDSTGIVGVKRFLDKTYRLFTEGVSKSQDDMKIMKLMHKTIKKIGEDIDNYKFNTSIAAMMIMINEGLPSDAENQKEWKTTFLQLLHPFAPHMAEELWEFIGNTTSIFESSWPEYHEFMLVEDQVTIAVQIGGKMRGTYKFTNGVTKEEVIDTIYDRPEIAKWLDGKEIIKEIFIPNKILNVVVK